MMEEEEETLFDQEGLLGRKSLTTEEQIAKRTKFMKTGALTMSFFSMGLCVAIAGTTLPDLGNRVDRDTEHMTFILVARSIGYLIGAGIGGILSDFFDQQLILFYILVCTAIATVAVPWCTSLYALATMIGVQGTAMGVLDTGGNLFCIRLWGKQSAPYMQFLHFTFGVGAFLAPLIARPFLTDSITEYSSNLSYRILPYSSHNHTTGLRHSRDLSHVISHFKQSQHLYEHHELLVRDVDNGLTTTTQHFLNESYNSTDQLNTNLTSTSTQIPIVRPKKPETVVPVKHIEKLAGAKIVPKKKLTKPSIKDEDMAKDDPSSAHSPDFPNSDNNCTQAFCPGNLTSHNQSSHDGNHTDDNAGSRSSSSTITTATSTTTISTTTLTTTITTPTTSTTSTTTTTATTTTPLVPIPISTVLKNNIDSTNEGDQSDEENDGTLSVDDSAAPLMNNTSQGANDLVNAMIETLRNMSKIQFAYLIVGLFLLCNAFYFISLFYKDGKKCSYRPEPSHEDLIRPPDPKSFVMAILTLLFFFFFFYVGMEQTFGILLTTFAVEYTQAIWTPAQAATVIAVFWGCVAAGRGIGILISHYFKAPCMMVLNLCITAIAGGLLSFALIKYWFVLWLGTALLGVGMSSTFATTISWADSYYPLSGKATAVFVAGSGFGQMSIPVMTGYLYQNINRMCLMYVVFGSACMLCIIYIALQTVASCKGTFGTQRSHSGFMMLGTAEEAGDSLDMDLIQAGGMGSVIASENRKHNGFALDGDEAETTQLVELSD